MAEFFCLFIYMLENKQIDERNKRRKEPIMIYATKVRMQPGCGNSQYLTEIDSIFLSGDGISGLYTKESIHDYLNTSPGTIQVGIPPFPDVIPALSSRGEKYVKSEPNKYGFDNLLCLPRI